METNEKLCFNPYSTGSYSGSDEVIHNIEKRFGFQSLFYWKLFWKTGNKQDKDMKYIKFQSLFYWKLFWKFQANLEFQLVKKFQSLFYWKLFWKTMRRNVQSSVVKVSILILLEVILEADSLCWNSYTRSRFQSLFYWKLFWKLSVEDNLQLFSRSFNPYSTGSYSGRISRNKQWVISAMFQSLFYWKLFWKKG